MIHAFLLGIVFAFGLIIPLGPQNMFVLSQGISNKRRYQVYTVAATASLCDTLLIVIAVVGLTLVILKLFWLREVLLGIGVLFLIYIGYQSWGSKPHEMGVNDTPKTLGRLVVFTMAASLLNPYALLDTVVTIGSASLSFEHYPRLAFAIGCILTSWLWFFSLSIFGRVISRFKAVQQYQGKVAGIIMWCAAVYLFVQLIRPVL